MSATRDVSAQETGGHVLFGGSKSPALYVLYKVKLNVQLLAAFDGRACLLRKSGRCHKGRNNSAPAAALADFLSVVKWNFILVQVVSCSSFPLQTR